MRTEDNESLKIESDNVVFYGAYRRKDKVLYITYVDPERVWRYDVATIFKVRDLADEYTISIDKKSGDKPIKAHMYELRQYCGESKRKGYRVGDYVSFLDKKKRNRRGIICKVISTAENSEMYNILIENGTLEKSVAQFQVSTIEFFIGQPVLFFSDNKDMIRGGVIDSIDENNEAKVKSKNEEYSKVNLKYLKHKNHFKYEVGSEVFCRIENHYLIYYAGRINKIKTDGTYVVLFLTDETLRGTIPYEHLLPHIPTDDYFISEYVLVKETQKIVVINEKVDKFHFNVRDLGTNEYYTVQITEIAHAPLKVNDFDSVYYCDDSGLYPCVITRIDDKAKLCSGKLKLDQAGFDKIKMYHFKKLHV